MNNLFLIRKFTIYSKILKQNRNYSLCIPKGFENVNLPILYLLDGGENEKLYYVLNEVSELLANNKISPFIIVGIENIDRNYDFTTNTLVRKDRKWVPKFGNSIRFRKFITEELINEVESNFQNSIQRSIFGESLGGLFVMDLMYNSPEFFDQYLVVDPSLWWNNNELLNKFITGNNLFSENFKLWISASKTVAINRVTDSFNSWIEDKMSKSNYSYKLDLNETHFTIFKSNFVEIITWSFPYK